MIHRLAFRAILLVVRSKPPHAMAPGVNLGTTILESMKATPRSESYPIDEHNVEQSRQDLKGMREKERKKSVLLFHRPHPPPPKKTILSTSTRPDLFT